MLLADILISIAAEEKSGEITTTSTAIFVAIVMGAASIVGTAIAGLYTFRSAKRNTEVTREIERDKISTSSWQAQVEAWRSDVVTLRQQRAEDKLEHARQLDEMRVRYDAQLDEMRRRITLVMDAHEEDRREHRQQRQAMQRSIHALQAWGRIMIQIAETKGLEYPPPPPGVIDTTPGGGFAPFVIDGT